MRHRVVKALIALAACLPATALAQQPSAGTPREGSWELSVGAGAAYLDNQIVQVLDITDPGTGKLAPGGALRLGYHLNRMWSLSAGLFAGYDKPATVLQPFGAVTWTPNVDAKTSPFVTLGAGVTNVSWSDSGSSYKTTSQFGVHLGVGLLQALSDRMALRVELREQYEKFSESAVFPSAVFNGTGSVGLSFFFGGRRAPVASVALNPPNATLESFGATEQLAATPLDQAGRPLAGRAVAWSSSNDSVASVSPAGLVTAVGDGAATITATSEAASGSASITVAQAPATLAVAPDAATLTALGQTQQLAASGQDANNNAIQSPQVTWTSSGPAVSVSASGLVTAMGNGTATVTAAANGRTAAATITVAQAIASVSVMPAAATVTAAGGSARFTAQAKDANGRPVSGKVITWASSAPNVATTGAGGVVTGVGNGTAQISATVEGQTGTATLTVAIPARAAPAPAPVAAAPAVALPTTVSAPALVLHDVNFRPNSAVLPPEAAAELDAVAQGMQGIPNSRWEIGGYTSTMGNAARNLALSRRRALSVRTYLIRHGVPAAQLVAVGYGDANPIASNATAAGRRQNMRVQIKRLR